MKISYIKKLALLVLLLSIFSISAQAWNGKYKTALKESQNRISKITEDFKNLVTKANELETTNTELQGANQTLQEDNKALRATLSEMEVVDVELAADEVTLDETGVGEVAQGIEGVDVEISEVGKDVSTGISETSNVLSSSTNTAIATAKKYGKYIALTMSTLDNIYEYLKDKDKDDTKNTNSNNSKSSASDDNSSQNKINKANMCVLNKIDHSLLTPLENLGNKISGPINKIASPLKKVNTDITKLRKNVEKVSKPLQTYLNKIKVFQNLAKDLKNELDKDISWKFTYPSPTWKDLKRKKNIYIHVNARDALKGGKQLEKQIKKTFKRYGKIAMVALKKFGLNKVEKKLKKEANKGVSKVKTKIKDHSKGMKKLANKILNMPELKKIKSFIENNPVSELIQADKGLMNINLDKYKSASKFNIKKAKAACNAN